MERLDEAFVKALGVDDARAVERDADVETRAVGEARQVEGNAESRTDWVQSVDRDTAELSPTEDPGDRRHCQIYRVGLGLQGGKQDAIREQADRRYDRIG